jgi:hypothetical protein
MSIPLAIGNQNILFKLSSNIEPKIFMSALGILVCFEISFFGHLTLFRISKLVPYRLNSCFFGKTCPVRYCGKIYEAIFKDRNN